MPSATPKLTALRFKSQVIRQIRQFFCERGYWEVDTPVLIKAPAPEPHIVPPQVLLRSPQGDRMVRYLQASPELMMKRLLSLGAERIFQIAPAFRDGDFGAYHQPEFRLLEWYAVGSHVATLAQECAALLHCLQQLPGVQVPPLLPKPLCSGIPPALPCMAIPTLFKQLCGIDLDACPDQQSLYAACRAHNLYPSPTDTMDELFHRAFVAKVDPFLAQQKSAFILQNFPVFLSSLAKRDTKNPNYQARLELYYRQVELGNGFEEECNPQQARHYFAHAQKICETLNQPPMPLDESYLACLHQLPACAGMAIGIDRLVAVLMDKPHIEAWIDW